MPPKAPYITESVCSYGSHPTDPCSGLRGRKKIPIIALTANAFDEDVQRSLLAGLNAHLSKPVEPDALFETLETLIS